MALKLNRLREIYADQFSGLTVPAELVEPIKRAMYYAAEVQRLADAETAVAQSGHRNPYVCGNCAAFVSKKIKEGKPE